MPFVAEASAQWQGLALGEVCSVYGVSVAPHGAPRPELPTSNEHVGGDHCVLQALAVLGTAEPPPAAFFALPLEAPPAVAVATTLPRPDAAARWIAQRKHGPPGTA